MKYISKNSKDTLKIAEKFLKKIKSDKKRATVVALSGDLGAGKTTFTKMVGKILGIKKNIHSPTFVIMKKYKIFFKGFENLVHIDAYRLIKDKEILNLGWKEILNDPKNLVFIEWPENVKKVIPKKRIKICILHKTKDERILDIKLDF